MRSSFLTIATFLFLGVHSAKLPNYLKKCRKTSHNSACVVQNFKATIDALIKNDGEPKFKLQGLRPVRIEKIDLQATPQLHVVLRDVDFHGFDAAKAKAGSFDGDTLYVQAHVPRVEIISNYEVSGKILILPIQGSGTGNITLVDFDVEYKGKLHTEERKGKKYYQVASDSTTNFKFNNVKQIYWQLDNLFNGDPRLGPEMNRFLNENSMEVFKEVQPAMEEAAAYSIVNQFVNSYLHFVPIDELFEN